MNELKTKTKAKKNEQEYFLYSLLCMVYITFDLMSYMYVYYIVDIFNFIVSCSVFFFTVTYMISDIIVELYGYKYARRLIWFSLFCETFFAVLVYFLGTFNFSGIEHNSNINLILSQNIMRIFFTSLVTTPTGDFVNSFFLSRWKILLKGKFFVLRSIAASSIGIIVYCLLTHTMLFYNVLSLKQLLILMGSSILFKLSFILLCSIPTSLIMKLIKKYEKIDQYDYAISYNPFKLD